MSKLYIVPTPIGNLEDISHRAIRILGEVDIILAEDTRRTGILLKKYGISRPTRSHHKFNEHQHVRTLAARIGQGEAMALVSEAGTPGISDPGYLLIRECIEQNVPVEALPGPTAFLPALVASGLPCDRFCFEGFLPQKKGRSKRLEALRMEERTMVFYESPFRVHKTLARLAETFGAERRACLARELSKIHEEYLRGTLSGILASLEHRSLKGECVLIVAGC